MTTSRTLKRGAWLKATTLAAALVLFVALHAPQARATHVSCGDVITQDTTLDGNLSCNEASALSIGADRITLNLNGHTVLSVTEDGFGAGLTNQGHAGVTIKDGNIVGGSQGVVLIHVAKNHLTNISARGELYGIGLELRNSDRNRVDSSKFAGGYRGTGVYVLDSDRNRLERNIFQDGIGLERSNRNRIERNTARAGIGVNGADNMIQRNTVRGVGNYPCGCAVGMTVSGPGNVLRFNVVSENQAGGIALRDADHAVLADNVASGNGGGDFGTTPPADGIFVDPASERTLIRRNTTDNNTDDGIDTDSPETTLTSNTANANGDLGIEAVPGVNDRGGNRAFGNGNPLQCLNVACR